MLEHEGWSCERHLLVFTPAVSEGPAEKQVSTSVGLGAKTPEGGVTSARTRTPLADVPAALWECWGHCLDSQAGPPAGDRSKERQAPTQKLDRHAGIFNFCQCPRVFFLVFEWARLPSLSVGGCVLDFLRYTTLRRRSQCAVLPLALFWWAPTSTLSCSQRSALRPYDCTWMASSSCARDSGPLALESECTSRVWWEAPSSVSAPRTVVLSRRTRLLATFHAPRRERRHLKLVGSSHVGYRRGGSRGAVERYATAVCWY